MNNFLLIAILVLFSGFFSGAEIAISSTPIYKIKQLLHSHKKKSAKILLILKSKIEKTLITILIGNTLINVIISILAARIGDELTAKMAMSTASGFLLISVLTTFIILLFGEIIPKVFSSKLSLQISLAIAKPIRLLSYILRPILIIFELIMKVFSSFLNGNNQGVSKNDVEIFIQQGQKDGIFTETESRIIKNFLYFDERGVESILKHRTEIFAISDETVLKDALEEIAKSPYSRVPVFKKDKDNIIGLLTIKDLLKFLHNKENTSKKIKDFIIRDVYKVPVTANIFDIFLKMKKGGQHFAIVIDEFGGTEGIITMEDILEDMLGDIKDEFDAGEESGIVKLNNQEIIVKGDVLLREIIDYFYIDHFEIPKKYADDISEEDMTSYIILEILKTFAQKGEIVKLGNLKFEVIETKRNKIQKVKVTYEK
ncbi:hemolysin family protein [Candidatus Gracilibacteria bacterium]|nr:hemolysin family protein [Candidatus Gracilibacteria bacterium]